MDYDEVFSLVSRIEVIRLFLAYASFKDFVVYQMDVKSDFLYGKIEEEVYVGQPLGFEDPDFPNKVYKVEKALYGLHPLTYKYVTEILKKFGFSDVKAASTPMETHKPLLKDTNGEDVDEHLYRSMIGSLMYLSSLRPDIMFACVIDFMAKVKKQTVVANSTTEAEYIAASNYYRQFWATAKAKTVNGEVQLQALVDGKKQLALMGYEKPSQKLTFYKAFFSPQWKFLIHTILQFLSAKTTAWNEFSSTMASAIICLATNKKFNFSKYIFKSMVKNVNSSVEFLMYPRFVQVFLDKQVGDMSTHNRTYDAPCHTKKIFANMKREGKGFSGKVTPLFQTMMVQAQEEGEGSAMPTDPQNTPTISQLSTSQPQKKQPRRKKRKGTEDPQLSGPTKPVTDNTKNVASVPTHSNDPLLSGEDRLKLNELMELCISLSQRVLDLENTKTSQGAEITKLKERVKKLERNGSYILTEIMTSSEQSNDVSQTETEITSDSNIIPYSQYLSETQQETVQNSNSSAQQDVLILSMFEQLNTQVTHCTNVNKALTTELDRYKEEVKDLKEMQNVENSFSGSNEQYAEIVRLKETLFEQVQEKDSLMKTVSDLKKDLKMEENRNIDREIALEKKIKQLDNIIFKRGQSAQTVHMMTKSKICYDHSTKQAIGFEKPFYLKKVRESKPKLEHAYWKATSVPALDLSHSSTTVKVEVPKELPKVSMVNTSLKKLKRYLTDFDLVVKERTTATAITEGTWGFEHTKACFRDEIIPFIKELKDILPITFRSYLIEELCRCNKKSFISNGTAVQTISLGVQNFQKLKLNQEQGLVIAALKNELRKLKGKAVDKEAIETHSIDPNVSKENMEPITSKLLNKRTAHSSYIKHTQEEALVLRDIVEHVKANYPQDSLLESAFRYNKVIQDLLSHISRSCPSINNFGPQLVEVTLRKTDKKVRFAESLTSTENTKPDSTSNKISNNECCNSRGVRLSTMLADHSLQAIARTKGFSKPTISNSKNKVVEIVLWYLDSSCSKHMTGDRSQLTNFISKFLGTVKFGNDQTWAIIYFLWDQYCDSNLEVAFRQHTCFIRNLEGVDLLTESQGDNLYTLSLGNMMASSPICLLSKPSKRKYFGYTLLPISLELLVLSLNLQEMDGSLMLCTCIRQKFKGNPTNPNPEDTNHEKSQSDSYDLCGAMRVASVNGKHTSSLFVRRQLSDLHG
ncbi:retrovirus-related pol polyprotein from transposon TNT 1-94 [Tanacetum coccineum]